MTCAKDKLEKAFKDMFCEMPYSEITVTELTKRAGVNRKTFYQYYRSLENMLTEIQDEYINRTYKYERIRDTEILTRIFLSMVEAQGDFGETLWGKADNGYLYHLVSNKARKELWPGKSKEALGSYDDDIILYYIQLTTVRLYRQWLRDGKKITLEELTDILVDMLCKGVFERQED